MVDFKLKTKKINLELENAWYITSGQRYWMVGTNIFGFFLWYKT